MSLPAAAVGQTRTLQLVYQEPIRPLGMTGRVRIAAPKLWLRADRGQKPVEVPVADLHWSMRLPTGYQVTRSDGTVTTTVERPEPAVVSLAKGVGEFCLVSPLLLSASRRNAASVQMVRPEPGTSAPSDLANFDLQGRAIAPEELTTDNLTLTPQEKPAETPPPAPSLSAPGRRATRQYPSAKTPSPANAPSVTSGESRLPSDLPIGYPDADAWQQLTHGTPHGRVQPPQGGPGSKPGEPMGFGTRGMAIGGGMGGTGMGAPLDQSRPMQPRFGGATQAGPPFIGGPATTPSPATSATPPASNALGAFVPQAAGTTQPVAPQPYPPSGSVPQLPGAQLPRSRRQHPN